MPRLPEWIRSLEFGLLQEFTVSGYRPFRAHRPSLWLFCILPNYCATRILAGNERLQIVNSWKDRIAFCWISTWGRGYSLVCLFAIGLSSLRLNRATYFHNETDHTQRWFSYCFKSEIVNIFLNSLASPLLKRQSVANLLIEQYSAQVFEDSFFKII
jgi:hypothetical protein